MSLFGWKKKNSKEEKAAEEGEETAGTQEDTVNALNTENAEDAADAADAENTVDTADMEEAESRENTEKPEEKSQEETFYQMGLDGENKGDYEAAFRLFLAAARTGYAPAQFKTGLYYETGRGINMDKAEALSWYRKAADQNYTAALFNLGYLYYYGEGTEKDEGTGIRYISKAADQGDSAAIEFLESMEKMAHRQEEMQKMNERKPLFIRRIRKMPVLYTITSVFSGHPYVGFDKYDSSWFTTAFTQKEMAEEFSRQMKSNGRDVRVDELKNKDFLRYFGGLYTYGINCINFTDYKDFYHIYLPELAKRDLSKIPKGRMPIENPKCVRAICMYLQEARRKPEVRLGRDQLLQLDHAMGAQLQKATFLMPVRAEEKDGKKLPQLVLLTRADSEQRYIPLFTDLIDYSKFSGKENKFNLLKLGIRQLAQLKLPETANQFILNVDTFRMILPMDYLRKQANAMNKVQKNS